MTDIPIPAPFTTVEEVIAGLEQLEAAFLTRRDRRGVFVTAYSIISRKIHSRFGTGGFRDDAWVRTYLIAFGNLYRQALADYEGGQRGRVPRCWQQAFDTSVAGLALVMQDLLLGINAHINRDLGFALNEAGIADRRDDRYADHTKINEILREATEEVQDRIAAMYAAGLGRLDQLLGQLDEEITAYNFELARENAWMAGLALANARSDAERALVGHAMDEQALRAGRLLLFANERVPWLIRILRRIEDGRRWWDVLPESRSRTVGDLQPVAHPAAVGAAGGIAGGNFAGVAASMPEDALGAAPGDLDEVIRRLSELITELDRQRNRLSVYATVYRAITRKVKQAVEAGRFKDPDWMVRLDVAFARRYFAIIDAFRSGQTDRIPLCWIKAIEAVQARKTMIVQDIAVQITPRVVYDLPITMVEVGMDDNLDDRKHDYELTYQLFIEELDCIQEMIARKYSTLVIVYDALGGPLDEFFSNVLYTRSRREAWTDALALHAATPSERERIIRSLDQKALRGISGALFYNIPPMSWIAHRLRDFEDRFEGSWSSTIDECA